MTLQQRMALTSGGSLALFGADNGYIFTDRTNTNYSGWNLYANNGKASLYRYTVGGNTITVDSTGSLGLQGVTSPTAPLTTNNATGNKIDFYYGGANARYGIGLQAALLQMYSSSANDDIAFGYGSSTNMTENMRIKGNGNVGIGTNPTFKLDVAGRMRLRNEAAGVTSGIWWDGPTGVSRAFLGTFNTDNIGFYGVDYGWGMFFNHKTGQMNIGATRNANDLSYKLNVGGKILAEEVRVQLQNNWPDYVFEDAYQKMSIEDLGEFVKINKHLPNIPSAKEVENNGQQLGEIQRKMLEKIEELSLYIIDLKKEIELIKKK